MSPPMSKLQPYFYDSTVELYIVLHEMHHIYHLQRGHVVSTKKYTDRNVIVTWKPPGGGHDVPICEAEVIVRDTEPKFETKMYMDFDSRDAGIIVLTFKVKYWSDVPVPLHLILQAGSEGLTLPVPLVIPPEKYDILFTRDYQRYIDWACSRVTPAKLFVRAELINRVDRGVYMEYRLSQTARTYSVKQHYMEVFKMNQENLTDITFPYTLVARTNTVKPMTVLEQKREYLSGWKPIYLLLSRICNNDLDRTLKIEIIPEAQGEETKESCFCTTTVGDIMKLGTLSPRLDYTESGEENQKLELSLRFIKDVTINDMDFFLKQGLELRRLYAVDFSNTSNWNLELNRRTHFHYLGFRKAPGLASGVYACQSPYEDGLELVNRAVGHLFKGDTSLLSFGRNCVKQYKLFADCPMCDLYLYYKKTIGESLSDITCKKCLMAPLLRVLMPVMIDRQNELEYTVVFIFTDGKIADFDDTKELLLEFSMLPVSLIFIGIGQGDFQNLIDLQNAWWTPTKKGRLPLRNIVHVVQFRSFLAWRAVLTLAGYSCCFEIFQKEIMTAIRNQLVTFMRLFR